MSDILDKVYESLTSRTDLTSFDRRIYELLLAFHRLPLPNYNMPPLSMLAFRSNQTEKAVMQCLFRLRDAGLVRVLTDRSGIFPAYYRVIENPVLPEPPAQEHVAPEPVVPESEPGPRPAESGSNQVYWAVPCVECIIAFVDIEAPETYEAPSEPNEQVSAESVQAEPISSEPPKPAMQTKRRTRTICHSKKSPPVNHDTTGYNCKTYPETMAGQLHPMRIRSCRAGKADQATSISPPPTTSDIWLGQLAPR